jgi:hypothetical protein
MTSSSVKCSRGRTVGLKRWLQRMESAGLNYGFEGLVGAGRDVHQKRTDDDHDVRLMRRCCYNGIE